MTHQAFLEAYHATMRHEGWSSDNPLDPGGRTYRGISRNFWPEWPGWDVLDSGGIPTDDMVQDFYRVNFWNRIRGDEVAGHSVPLAVELFDTAVNIGVSRAVAIMQRALNLLNRNQKIYGDLPAMGVFGAKTIECLSRYFISRPGTPEQNERRLLVLMNVLQGMHYVALMEGHPDKEEFRGWFDRVTLTRNDVATFTASSSQPAL